MYSGSSISKSSSTGGGGGGGGVFCGRWLRLLGGCERCGRGSGLDGALRGGFAAGRLAGAEGVLLRGGDAVGRGACGSGGLGRDCEGAARAGEDTGRGAGSAGGLLRWVEAFCRIARVLTGSGAGLLCTGRGRAVLRLAERTGTIAFSLESCGASPVIKRGPAVEIVLINRMRVTHTMIATKIGTARISRLGSITLVLAMLWLTSASETPHQVRMAFMVAANNQATNRNQVSFPPLSF